MQFTRRYILPVALVLAASAAFGSSVAPNVQVNVKQGRTKVFTGITDGSGRFTTVPVEPGVYTFELRALKTAPPAQYFLLLSGAKPVSAPIADKKAVLTMDAQVRTARSVTGQVTARRLRILAPADTASATGAPAAVTAPPTPAATPTAFLSRAQAAAVGRTAAPARVAVPVRATAPAGAPQQSTAPNQAAPAGATPASGPVPRPSGAGQKMINGKPHVWVPIAPGSTVGRWVPARR